MERLLQRRFTPLTSAETGWPRISQPVYQAVFIAYLPIIIIAIVVRVAIKFRNNRNFELDDLFLVLALLFSLASWACTWQMRDLIYLQMELVLGMKAIVIEDIAFVLAYFRWYNASLVTTWISVYSIKLSFMFFFRKLISRVKSLEIYWTVIMCILIPTALFSAFFSFWICPDLSITYIMNCPISSMIDREGIFLYTTTALDIFTDLLIISVPILLLSKVSISFKRKLILGFALSLNIFMIVVCTIRAAGCKLLNGIIDSTWLALWQCVETNTAIVLMSLTAYRSLYRQGASPGYTTPVGLKKRPLWPTMRPFQRLRKNQAVQENEVEEVLPEEPQRVATAIHRTATKEDIHSQLLSSAKFTSHTLESTITSDDGL